MKKTLLLSLIALSVFTFAGGQSLVTPAPPAMSGGTAFKGYFNITDMGLLVGSTQNRHPAPFSFMTTNGYHLRKQVSLGLGVGVEFLSGSYMPIVVDARYYVRNTGFSPFFSLYGGYSLPLDDDGANGYGNSSTTDAFWPYQPYKPYQAKGGWLLNPGFGIRNMFGENFGIIFSIGYRVQRLYFTSDLRKLTVDYNRLSVKIGIIFR